MSIAEITDPAEYIRQQNARGKFGYWDTAIEAAWKAQAPPRPEPPTIRDRRGWPVLTTTVGANSRTPSIDPQNRTFEWMLDCGRSYMVGKAVPMASYVRSHRSPVTAWQKTAYAWALANPFYKLYVEMPGRDWEVYAEGDYVIFALPHQDAGGERHYVSQNGRSKVLVNVD